MAVLHAGMQHPAEQVNQHHIIAQLVQTRASVTYVHLTHGRLVTVRVAPSRDDVVNQHACHLAVIKLAYWIKFFKEHFNYLNVFFLYILMHHVFCIEEQMIQ